MDWQRLIELLVAAIAGGVATNLPRLLVLRRHAPAEVERIEAETDGERADTQLALVQSYKLLVADLRDELQVARAGIDMRDVELRNYRETEALLYEQKMAAIGYVTAVTARLAGGGTSPEDTLIETGHNLMNGDIFAPATKGKDEPIQTDTRNR